MSADSAATAAPGAPSSGDALVLDDVIFPRGTRVPGHVSIRVGRGEIVGLLGPNGAGKTSLLRVIAGELKPLKGRIWAHQLEITDLDRRRRQDAGVFVCLHDRRRWRANRSMLEIVAAVMHREPKVLVVDELFLRLENALPRRALIALLKTCRDAGVGVLITDHEVREALSLVDRAYIIHEGKILVAGTVEFLTRPRND